MRKIYANAVLSDGEILFWWIGNECHDIREFYKDFYRNGINYSEYEKTHALKLVKMGFIDPTEDWDYNNFIFKRLSREFFKQWGISKDSKGDKPYDI